MKEALFIRRRYTKGGPSLSEMVYKRIRGWTSEWKAGGWGVGGLVGGGAHTEVSKNENSRVLFSV